jgi:hypothetical protein
VLGDEAIDVSGVPCFIEVDGALIGAFSSPPVVSGSCRHAG